MSIPYFPGLLDPNRDTLPPPQYARVAAPVPAPPVAAPITGRVAKRTSLFDRFKQALLPTPAGMDGLLSPDDENAARRQGFMDMGLSLLDSAHGAGPGQAAPSLGQAIARGIHTGRDSMNASAQQSVQGGLLQDDLERKQHAEAVRAQVLRQFPPAANETQDQAMSRLTKTYSALLAGGDIEGAGKMSEVIKTIMAREPKPGPVPTEHDLGDRLGVFDSNGNLIRTYPKGTPPKMPADVSADQKFSSEQTNKILDDFRMDTKDFNEAKSGYEVLKGALANPGIAKPFAVLDAYARVVNPGAAVRMGTMAILQEMGSVDDRVRRWISMTQNGQWPADMVESIKSTVDGIMAQHAKTYSEVRNRAILRAKRAGVKNIEDLLGSADYGGTAAPAASTKGNSAAVRQFLKK